MAVGEAGKVVLGCELETKQFDAQIKKVEGELEELERYYEAALDPRAKEDPKAIQDLEVEIEKTKNKLVGLKKAKENANKTPIEDPKVLGEINLNLSNIIKKVGKWALAVFSVRSAYLFVRSAVSTISQYDQQLGANIQYIRYALAMTIKPIVEWIVNAVYTLLQYINHISKAWFKYDLFANATAKNFNKANNSAKKLQRTMAGFDEMNVLSSNKDTGVGTNMDLSKEDVPIPGWVDWIAQNKDTILGILKQLAIVFGVAKLAEVTGVLGKLGGALGLTKTAGIWGALNGIAILGGLAVIGAVAVSTLQDIEEMKEDLSTIYERSEKHVKNEIKNEKELDKLLAGMNVRLKGNNDTLQETDNWWSRITGLHQDAVDNASKSVSYQKDFLERLKEIEKKEKLSEEDNKNINNYLQQQLQANYKLMEEVPKNSDEYKNIENTNKQIRDRLLEQYENMKKQGYAEDEIKEKIGYTRQDLYNMVKDPYTAKVHVDVNEKSKKTVWDNLTDWWKKLSDTLQIYFSVGGSWGGHSTGGARHALGGIIPYASGGIINRPGSGVPVGGEHGMEGIIPMTHEGQMQLLGETIAKYINVNLVNNTNLDGRLIARQINRVQNNTNFAANR